MQTLTANLLGAVARNSSASAKRLSIVADRLFAVYGLPRLGNYRNPVREIFYIMLSAKTTDAQYRRTYRELHAHFPTVELMASASVRDIRRCIHSGGLAAKRSKHVRDAARKLSKLGRHPVRQLKAMTPSDAFAFLISLPGLGAKSALCVMMYSLDLDAFPVDVNVQRIAERLGIHRPGLTHGQSQRRLAAVVPEGRSRELHVGMVVHGRSICLPRKPKCGVCCLRDVCRAARRLELVEDDLGEEV